ncbi:glycosyltransferase [Spongiibacter taiwanensis]|uniref:glycosyltransferase family 2 protein n=1 Tax=Spongiibacter taiwanensis TaxID=1748242 RepID=UPI00203540D9|nr:glycosyltransferase [Spongiibacter taiwanensis]USA44572.1 glycosyltransferase [Spongiibacter taiwanensis]
MKKPLINIAVCTCQRLKLLRICLASLVEMSLPEGVEVCLSVIDNDVEGSARDLIAEFADGCHFAIYYVHQPKRGIPVARNTAVEKAHALNADYLVFIDDDEWVEVDWLLNLYAYAMEVGGDKVISGAVCPEVPADVPEHLAKLFVMKERRTGTRLETCATNNVMIPSFVTRDIGMRFDESQPLAGGTDTLFFLAAAAKGVVILKCAEALVHELIPPGRVSLGWLWRRKYRVGITLAGRRQQQGRGVHGLFLSSIVKVLGHGLVALAWVVIWQPLLRNKATLKAARDMGVVVGCLGGRIDSYSTVDGQ